jgi:toxin ParE1/3/4
MAVEVVFAPEARQDLEDILDHIAEDDPAAALRWIDRLEERCYSLAGFLMSGRARDDLMASVRMIAVRDYLIFYRIGAEQIEIMSVVHGARDPERIAAKIRGKNEDI